MKQLVAYITAAYPDTSFSIDVIYALKEAGVDILELGIPFSDPIADGPVIERANLMALHKGFKLETLFELSSKIGTSMDTYWMGYFNPFYHKGMDFFSQKANEYGIKGFIIPDLPHEEAFTYLPSMQQHHLNLISFVAPTDSKERISHVVKDAKGFIYLVAYAGITGAQASEDLTYAIASIKEKSQTPLFVGFGVNEKTAKERARGVDGVIVGSALVEVILDESLGLRERVAKVAHRARVIKEMINA